MNNLDASNREPLFYEVYPGSINDVSQLTCMIDKVHGYGYRNLGFILDRGYFSRKNLSYMEQNGYSFLIMIKGRNSSVLSYWKTMGDLKTAGQSIMTDMMYTEPLSPGICMKETIKRDIFISTTVMAKLMEKSRRSSRKYVI